MAVYNEADFVMQGREVKDPEIAKDELELYYDVKGKKNSDVHKNKLLDMSGQGKDGELSGFDYDGKLSGYDGDNGLVFDGIEDTLKTPKLNGIDANNFTYQLNNNILAFDGDEVKTIKNGSVEVGGRNYFVVDNLTPRVPTINSRRLYTFQVEPDKLHTLKVYGDAEGSTFRVDGEGVSFSAAKNEYQFTSNTDGVVTIDFWREQDLPFIDGRARAKLEQGNTATPWTPAPEDLLEATELKGNILGDMEDIVDASPRDRQSGKEIFTEHADDSHVRVEVDGQSYQRFDPNARNMVPTKYEDWLVEHHYSDEGALEARSNRMAASWLIEVEPNKSYYYDTGNPDIWYVIRTLDSNKTIESESWGGSGSSGVKTTNSTTKYLGVGIYAAYAASDGAIVKDEFQAGNIKPIIQDASVTDRSFIEYVPKAPTPDYPIEIESVNDFDVVSSPVGRNLVIPSDVTPGHNIRSDGSINRETGPFVTDFIEVKADEFYTITMLIQKNGYSRVAYYDLDKNFIKRDLFRYQEVTQIKPEQDGFIRWSPDVDESINDYVPGYKIELDTDHPLIDKVNFSLSEPLRSVGDVHDRLFRDSDGLWKIERKTKEVHMGNQYQATDDYTETNTPDGLKVYRISGYIDIRMNGNTTHINSSHFTYNPENNLRNAKLNHIGMNGSSGGTAHNLLFVVSADDFPTLSSFNDWLVEEENSGTPVTLQVQLRPEDIHTETLDQELQDQLNTLKSFKDSNYIYTVQNTDNPHKEQLKPTLHATFNSKDYLKETRTLTNLLIWARELTDGELIHHNQLFLNRFNLQSDTVSGEPIEQTLNLLHGGMVGHSLEQNYTINI